MIYPYGIISDTHYHRWTAFSTEHDGVNSRLRIALDETWDAAQKMRDAGCQTIYHAGDMFHVRGAIAPSVLNPVLEVYQRIVEQLGMEIVVIPGNHDLEGNESSFTKNASSALQSIGVRVYATPTVHNNTVLLVPWIASVSDLLAYLRQLNPKEPNLDLILHAPINGVIRGIPDHGLEAEELEALPFQRVFAGHYHNFKSFGNGVYSIGALTHQTWSDVGSGCGYLIVDAKEVTHYSSNAPRFVDAKNGAKVGGNYVRYKGPIKKSSDIVRLRDGLLKMGAAGVVIHPLKQDNGVNRSETIKVGGTLQESIHDFIQARGYERPDELYKLCEGYLAQTEEVA